MPPRTKRVQEYTPMETLYFILSACCAVYYVCMTLYVGAPPNFGWIWIAAAGVLFLSGSAVRHGRIHPGAFPSKPGLITAVLLGLAFIVILIPLVSVLGGMRAGADRDNDFVIVLGAQVRGTCPSRALLRRLEKAMEYGSRHPQTIFILSGAQGPGEDITEAQCMKTWLEENGFSNRMILEERSGDTRENLLYSDETAHCREKSTGILTNDFHVSRAIRLAKKLGFSDVSGIPAKGDPIMEVHYILRECFAFWKEILIGNI